MLPPSRSVHTCTHTHTPIKSVKHAHMHARTCTCTQCLLPSSRSRKHTHTRTHITPPLEKHQFCAREQSWAPPAWVLPLIPLHRPDWIPIRQSPQLRQAGDWWIDSGGSSHTILSILPLSYSLWCGRDEESCPLKPIYSEIFGMLLLSFFPR